MCCHSVPVFMPRIPNSGWTLDRRHCCVVRRRIWICQGQLGEPGLVGAKTSVKVSRPSHFTLPSRNRTTQTQTSPPSVSRNISRIRFTLLHDPPIPSLNSPVESPSATVSTSRSLNLSAPGLSPFHWATNQADQGSGETRKMISIREKCRPKHQVLILKCYPRTTKGAVDVEPNSSELSYLLYYATTRRSKVQKVGAFLEKKTASDVWRARIGYVEKGHATCMHNPMG